MAIDRNADAVVGMSPCEHSPLWATILPEDDSLNESFPDNISGIRSQDLPQFFRINGALYVCKTDFFLDKRTFLPATNGYAYRMPAERSIDIDTMADFKYAEAILTSGDIR
jgi:N-acylneuraminate cytidylyltransferase